MLLMAGKDYRSLLVMQDSESVDTEIFGFHVQQAVEKGLKSWLSLLGVSFPKKHDLDDLAARLADVGEELPDEFGQLLTYTDFATIFRYDAYPDMIAAIDREAITILVGRFIQHVENLLRQAGEVA